MAVDDSPASDASGAPLEGADALLDNVEESGTLGNVEGTGGTGRGAGAGNGPTGDGGVEDEEEDDGNVSDPPPMEYNANRDREIDEDPDHSDGAEGGARPDEEVCGLLALQQLGAWKAVAEGRLV